MSNWEGGGGAESRKGGRKAGEMLCGVGCRKVRCGRREIRGEEGGGRLWFVSVVGWIVECRQFAERRLADQVLDTGTLRG